MHALFSHTALVMMKLCRSNRSCIFRAWLRLRTFLFIGNLFKKIGAKNLRTNAINLRLTNGFDNGILKQPNKFNILISISVRILSFGKNAGFYSAYLYWLLNLFGDSWEPCIFRAWLRLRTFLFIGGKKMTTDTELLLLCQKIHTLRTENQLSQKEMAKKLGIGVATLRKIE